MATAVVTTHEAGTTYLHTWTGLAQSENGDNVSFPGAADPTALSR